MKKGFSLVLILLISFIFASPVWAQSGTFEDPIIDSQMTLEEALTGLSASCPPEIRKRQALIDVQYYSFDQKIHKGQVLIDERLAKDIPTIFQIALNERFPIQSVIPMASSNFNWNDERSMEANNTSSFNYRDITGSKNLSNHAYGFAIDINPLQNPYIKGKTIYPTGATYDLNAKGVLTEDNKIVQTFIRLGWTWGGHWTTLKDYQHFEKVLN